MVDAIAKGDEVVIAGGVLGRVAKVGDTYLNAVSYTHLRAHETVLDLVCRLLLEKKKHLIHTHNNYGDAADKPDV